MGLLQNTGADTATSGDQGPWPEAGTAIWARLGCCETAVHPSRVESSSASHLAVAALHKPHATPLDPPVEGKTFLIGWREGTASRQVRVEFAGVSQDAEWNLVPVAAPALVQRRDFVRATWDTEIRCSLMGGEVKGRILDISEGGIRCVLPAMREPRMSRFDVEFSLDSGPVRLEVEIAWWATPLGEEVEVGLTFNTCDETLRDRLRGQAYGLQMAQRRSGLF